MEDGVVTIARAVMSLPYPKHVSEAIQYRSLDRRGLG